MWERLVETVVTTPRHVSERVQIHVAARSGSTTCYLSMWVVTGPTALIQRLMSHPVKIFSILNCANFIAPHYFIYRAYKYSKLSKADTALLFNFFIEVQINK